MEANYRERGLVSLRIVTDNEDLVIQGSAEAKHSDTAQILDNADSLV